MYRIHKSTKRICLRNILFILHDNSSIQFYRCLKYKIISLCIAIFYQIFGLFLKERSTNTNFQLPQGFVWNTWDILTKAGNWHPRLFEDWVSVFACIGRKWAHLLFSKLYFPTKCTRKKHFIA